MQLRYEPISCDKLLPDGIKLFIISLKLSIAAIKQLKIILIVLLQVCKLQKQELYSTSHYFYHTVAVRACRMQEQHFVHVCSHFLVCCYKLLLSVLQLQ